MVKQNYNIVRVNAQTFWPTGGATAWAETCTAGVRKVAYTPIRGVA